jgi:hypothetical protein
VELPTQNPKQEEDASIRVTKPVSNVKNSNPSAKKRRRTSRDSDRTTDGSSPSPVNGDTNNNHQQQEQGNKKYFCSFCPWAGVDSWCLKRHLNTHVKPYTCPMCDYKAARMERLQLHVGRVHAKKICSKCSALFEDQDGLDKHVDEEQ